jgi:SAM-dependent methyltransferase
MQQPLFFVVIILLVVLTNNNTVDCFQLSSISHRSSLYTTRRIIRHHRHQIVNVPVDIIIIMSASSSSAEWDKFSVEYEKRVEPFTSLFAEEMLRWMMMIHDNSRSRTTTTSSSNVATVKIDNDNDKKKQLTLLDVACGTGTVTLQAISLYGLKVTSTDISPSMVQRTKQRVKEQQAITIEEQKSNSNNDLSLSESTITVDGQISLPNEWADKFDFVVSNFGVIFFKDCLVGLKEMVRCTKSGGEGTIAFTSWGPEQQIQAFRIFPDVAKEICPHLISTGKPKRITGSIDVLKQLMIDAGCCIDSIKIIGPISKQLVVSSPEEYYNRFVLTSPNTAEMISKMDKETKTKFRSRVIELAKERGGSQDSTSTIISIPSSAYIAYGRRK